MQLIIWMKLYAIRKSTRGQEHLQKFVTIRANTDSSYNAFTVITIIKLIRLQLLFEFKDI